MKLTIARIRSFVKYTEPLETVLDSFFELYVGWMKEHPEYSYDTYNVSFDRKKTPKRTPETIKDADVIVIPSDSEFRYHGELQMNPKDLAKSQSFIEEIKPFIEGKKIIMWRSDRGDTEQLYREETFKDVNIKSFHTIDEIDFPGNIHGMKYHFITDLKSSRLFDDTKKTKDFAYWGRMKTGDNRDKIIRSINRDKDISQVLVGGFPSGVVRDAKWIKDWKVLLPMLETAKCTLCFNWKDPKATTSRYPEALAIGLIPFVWQNYDETNTYNITPWQRVHSFEELKDKITELTDDDYYEEKLECYRENYNCVLPTKKEYSKLFNEMMDDAINA